MDKSLDVVGHHRPSYILTFDLPEKVQFFRTLGLEVPQVDDPIFKDIRGKAIRLFETVLPSDVIVTHFKMSLLAANIIAKAMSLQNTHMRNAIIVSTCPEITALRNGASLSLNINRLVDYDGKILGIGPRPGTESISAQVEHIANYAHDRQVILVEDGSFTGKTLRYILEMLQNKRVRVSAVVLGFVFQNARDIIREGFNGEIFDIEKVDGIIDWMPDHDFMPFIPSNGRVIGHRCSGELLPIYDQDGLTQCVPYLDGFCPLTDWAGIPAEGCREITEFFISATYELFEIISFLNDSRILTIGDLSGTLPRVSIPFSLYGQPIVTKDTPILSFLKNFKRTLI